MKRVLCTFVLMAGVVPGMSRADTLHDFGTIFDFLGVEVIGQPNPLSGGADLLISQQFNGSVFDFGSAELTLQGPISLGISTGGRLLPVFEMSIATAVSSQAAASPLSFTQVIDVGPQVRTVSGSTLLDADFSINALGFYDLSLTYSNRTTLEREGIVNDTQTADSDIGPITLSGNIFLDALELLTDPYFEQTGRENPFGALSKSLIDLQNLDLATLLSPSDSGPEELAGLMRDIQSLQPTVSRRPSGEYVAHMVVPEPPVLVLLLVGVPIMLYRGIRSR